MVEEITSESLKRENIPTGEYNTICRSCLNENGIINLFRYQHDGILMGDLFIMITLSELNEMDDLPANLCQTCANFVMEFYSFKKRACASEIILLKMKNNNSKMVMDETEGKSFIDRDHLSNMRNKVSTVTRKKITKGIKCTSRLLEKEFICSFCNLKFESYVEYKQHRKKEADQRRKKLPCTVCKKLISTYKLKDHINTHTKERPYQCNICSEKFRFRSSLTRHNFRHIEKKPHECHICGKGFIQAPTLTDHLRTHTGEKSFICNICGKCFITKHALGNHINMHKVKDRDGNIIDDDLKCKQCNKNFTSKNVLKRHMYIHSDKIFLCSACGKKFSTKTLLDSHIKVHSGSRPYFCDICKKSFAQKNSLQKHHLTHTGEKPIACIICEKRFTQKSHLSYHMRQHSGERPYTCTYCYKTFNHTGSLKVHIRIHTGEKPFSCDICAKAFYDSSSMKKHKKIHEDIKTGSHININEELC